MKVINVVSSILLLAPLSVPARADFKYTETSKITGGAVKNAMKFAGVFSKKASQATAPVVTTHYVKGNRLRIDNPDGKIQIIDVEGRRIIEIDTQKHTYTETTFEQMKAAMQKAQQQAQKKMDQDPKAKDAKANVNLRFKVTPGTGTREILGQSTNEAKVEIQMDFQAQDTSASAQPGAPASGTVVTTMDMYVAPSVTGFNEFAEPYARMAKEINWAPPSNIQVDPRASQSLEELQKNSANLKGFPLLQYMTMSMSGQPDASGNAAPNSSGANSAPSTSSSNSDSTPTSMNGAVMKGLGGLFGKKKKQDDAADQNTQNPPPPSTPGSLMEMTIEVNSFSGTSLDATLFDVPAGFTRIAENPDQIIGGRPAKE